MHSGHNIDLDAISSYSNELREQLSRPFSFSDDELIAEYKEIKGKVGEAESQIRQKIGLIEAKRAKLTTVDLPLAAAADAAAAAGGEAGFAQTLDGFVSDICQYAAW